MTLIYKKKIEPLFIFAFVVTSLSIFGLVSFIIMYADLLHNPRVHEVYYDTQVTHVEKIELIQEFDTKNQENYIIKSAVTSEMTDLVL
jgi:hypothetical protein